MHECVDKTQAYAMETANNTNIVAVELNAHISRTRKFQATATAMQRVLFWLVVIGVIMVGATFYELVGMREALAGLAKGLL